MRYFSLLIVAGAMFLGACKNGNNTPKSSKEILEQAHQNMNSGAGKFTIDGPADWRKVDTTLNGIKVTFLMSPVVTDGFRANINVVSENAGKLSLEEYTAKNHETMSKYMANFNIIGQGDKEINGLPGKWLKYSSQQTGGQDVVALSYTVVKNGVAYIITGIMKKVDEAKVAPAVESAAATFKIIQ